MWFVLICPAYRCVAGRFRPSKPLWKTAPRRSRIWPLWLKCLDKRPMRHGTWLSCFREYKISCIQEDSIIFRIPEVVRCSNSTKSWSYTPYIIVVLLIGKANWLIIWAYSSCLTMRSAMFCFWCSVLFTWKARELFDLCQSTVEHVKPRQKTKKNRQL